MNAIGGGTPCLFFIFDSDVIRRITAGLFLSALALSVLITAVIMTFAMSRTLHALHTHHQHMKPPASITSIVPAPSNHSTSPTNLLPTASPTNFLSPPSPANLPSPPSAISHSGVTSAEPIQTAMRNLRFMRTVLVRLRSFVWIGVLRLFTLLNCRFTGEFAFLLSRDDAAHCGIASHVGSSNLLPVGLLDHSASFRSNGSLCVSRPTAQSATSGYAVPCCCHSCRPAAGGAGSFGGRHCSCWTKRSNCASAINLLIVVPSRARVPSSRAISSDRRKRLLICDEYTVGNAFSGDFDFQGSRLEPCVCDVVLLQTSTSKTTRRSPSLPRSHCVK